MANRNKTWHSIDIAINASLSAENIKELELKLPDFLESLGISEYNIQVAPVEPDKTNV